MMLHHADNLLKGFKWLWQNCNSQKQFQCPSLTHLITSHCSSHMQTDTSMKRAERVGEAILTALSDNSHYERAAPAICTQLSVKASTSQASSRTPSPRKPHLAAEWSPAAVAAARALCWHLLKYQSHFKVCSTFSPFSSQFSKEKIFSSFFLPRWPTLKKPFLLFVCTDPAAFVLTTMHFLFTEKKVDLKEIYRTFPWACLLHRE